MTRLQHIQPKSLECQSTCVMIDGDHLFSAFIQLKLTQRYDFKALKAWLLNQRPGCVHFYCGEVRDDRPHRQAFYNVLRRAAIRVVPVFHKGSHSASAVFDEVLRQKIIAKMVGDIRECTQRGCNTLILVSGSPGFGPVVSEVTKRGVDIELVFFREACSTELLSRASRFRNLRIHGLDLKNHQRQRSNTKFAFG